MHAATPRNGIQGTIFSEHEYLVIVVIFTISIFLRKKCENNEKNDQFLLQKYIICTIF